VKISFERYEQTQASTIAPPFIFPIGQDSIPGRRPGVIWRTARARANGTRSAAGPAMRQDRAMAEKSIAVVTGASSGIGAATARRLAAEGFHVVAAARRADRLDALIKEIVAAGGDATAVTCDVTSDASVDALAAAVAGLGAPCTLLVNNAGGARGLDPVESGSVADWQWMYDVNVLGTLRVTRALLPAVEASGAGTVVVIGSTAAFTVYEGGAGYTAAKHAQTALVGTLRLELVGRPVRVVEIDPGMVHTEEFSLNRLSGDAAKADAIYAGVDNPLVADDIADCVAWCATRPQHVNVDRLVVRPIAQAAQHRVARRQS
jgi:NADP-dependent 3-hydroxy acid dehydrogenase YdfG